MESEQIRRDFVKVLDEIEKTESLLAKRKNTINSQDREINSIRQEIEFLTERVKKARENFGDKNCRQIWLKLSKQKISAKSKLKKLIVKRTCENEEKTILEIKISELISERNRLQGLVRDSQ